MMDDLLVVYIFTISIELMLGLVLALTLLLIVAPLKPREADDDLQITAAPATRPRRDLPRTPAAALRYSFNTLTRGEDDLATLMHTRQLLMEYLDRRESGDATGSTST